MISVAGYPRDQDQVRTELQQLSDEWWPLETEDVVSTAERISSLSPSILLDLGGHTADNHPVFLSTRLATVQATYLGFMPQPMPNVVTGGLLMMCFWNGYKGLTPVLNLFGHCQDLVFVMSLLCMDCQKLTQFLSRKLIILYLGVLIILAKLHVLRSRGLVLFYLPIQMQSCSFAVIPLRTLRCDVIS